MKRSIWISLFLLFACTMLWAQPYPLTQWTHTINGDSVDAATDILQARDGTFMVCGYTATWTHGDWDIYVARLDSFGNIQWWQNYGGLYFDAPNAIRATADGNFVVAGYTQTQDSGPLHIYLMKINGVGQMQWDQTDIGVANEYVNDVQQTFDGGYILTGSTDITGPFNVYLRKTNSLGGVTWTRTIAHDNDEGFSIQQTPDSGYIIAGRTHNVQDDGWLIKTNRNGQVTWNRYIGQSGDETFRCVRRTRDGGYICAGTSNTNSGSNRPYLVKTDSSGTVKWWHIYGETYQTGAFYSVEVLADSNYILGGVLNSHFYIARIDTHGIIRWDEEYTNSLQQDLLAYAAVPTRDAGYVMAGYTVSATTGWDMYVVKTGRDRMTAGIHDLPVVTVPSDYAIRAFPNPFNASTVLDYVLPRSGKARVELYDLNGRRVSLLLDSESSPGEHRMVFDGSGLASGTYFVRLVTPGFAGTQKLVLMK